MTSNQKSYVQYVPGHCDRIVWRGSYYMLPLTSAPLPVETSPKHQGWCASINPDPCNCGVATKGASDWCPHYDLPIVNQPGCPDCAYEKTTGRWDPRAVAVKQDPHCATCKCFSEEPSVQETKPEPHPNGRCKCTHCGAGFVVWGDVSVHERSCSKNPAVKTESGAPQGEAADRAGPRVSPQIPYDIALRGGDAPDECGVGTEEQLYRLRPLCICDNALTNQNPACPVHGSV